MEKQFVCDKKNDTFAKWMEERPAVLKALDEEADFLKKREKSLQERQKAEWDRLFDALQKEGVIPSSYARDKTEMSYTKEHGQLFIKYDPNSDPNGNGGPGELLFKLLTSSLNKD